MRSGIRITAIVILAVVLIAIFVAPFTVPFGYVTEMDGSIGMIDHSGTWSEMNIFADLVYSIGDVVCHQEMSRTFMLNGNQLAVCSRDVSILAGMFAGLLFFSRSPQHAEDGRMLYVSFLFVVLMFVDWSVQFITGSDIMITRVMTGLLCGFAIAVMLEMAVIKMERNVLGRDE